MNPERAREVVAQYRSQLEGIGKAEGPFDKEPTEAEALLHANAMLDRMDAFLDLVEEYGEDQFQPMNGAWDKFNRWLGFMQGVFWLTGAHTLNEMRDHNRTASSESS